MKNYSQTAALFKAFCDENRIKIIEMLKNGKKCASELLDNLEIRQPTLSHHMKILCKSGVIKPEKTGKEVYYSISTEKISEAKKIIDDITKEEKNDSWTAWLD